MNPAPKFSVDNDSPYLVWGVADDSLEVVRPETEWILVSESLSGGADREDPSAELWGRRAAALVAGIWLAGFAVGFQTALAILTALGFCCAVIGLKWRFLGLLAIGVLCTLDPLTRVYLMHGGWLRWNTFNYLLLLVALGSCLRLLARRDVHTRLLGLLTLLIGAEMFMAPIWLHGIYSQMMLLAPFGLLVYFLRAAPQASQWYWFAVVSSTTSAIGGLMFYLQRGALATIDDNALSYTPLTGALAICLAFRCAATTPRQTLLLALAAANGTWVFLTGSRGSCLVMLICGLYLMWEIRRPSRVVVLAAISILLALTFATMFDELRERSLYRIGKVFDSDRSLANRTSGRSDLALGAWHLFLQHPWGVGSGAFPYYWSEREKGAALAGQSGMRMAHSAWMKVLAENGIPGFVLLALYVSSFALVGLRSDSPQLRRLGLMTTAVLAGGYIAQEFIAKGLWLTAIGASVILHSEEDGDAQEMDDAAE